MKPEKRGLENVGIISIGSHEEKILFVLSRLMSSTGVILSLSENFDYPQGRLEELIYWIESTLQHKGVRGVVFDVRVREWPEYEPLETAQALSQVLQDICSRQQISSSVFLTNGCQPLGNFMGTQFEIIEAEGVLGGRGPLDLTKFALEIGSDLLLMAKKARQRRDGKQILRDKIIRDEISFSGEKMLAESSSLFPSLKKMTISSKKKGYVHHLAVDEIHSLKWELTLSFNGSGFALLKKTGDPIEKGEGIVRVFQVGEEKKPPWESKFRKAFKIFSDPPEFQPFILERSELRLLS